MRKDRKIYGLYQRITNAHGIVMHTHVIATFWRRRDAEAAAACLSKRRRRRGAGSIKVRFYVREVTQYVV